MAGFNVSSQNDLSHVIPPVLPLSPPEYSRQHQDQLANILRLYFNRLNNMLQQLEWAQSLDMLSFNTSAGSVSPTTGQICWNSADATLEQGLEYGVVQQIGQETFARVKNSSGTTIPNGTVVGFAGADSSSLVVEPYLADGASPSVYILGVMTHAFPDSGQKGYCTVFGFVRGMDTTGTAYGETWASGDVLYASPTTAGGLTKVKPTAPNNVIVMAAVNFVDDADGVIFVRPTISMQNYFGTFSRITDYTPAAANTAYAVPYTDTRVSNGVVIGSPASRIVVPDSGLYDVSATLQWSSTNSSAKDVYGWIRKNGTDVERSSRILTITGSGSYAPVLISETVSLAASDYIEIMIASSSSAVYLHAAGATAFSPAAPAANLVVTQVQQ
jgi:hypothetical protein